MEVKTNDCKNCGQPLSSVYCAHCGQRASVHRVTFRETFNDLADNLFSISAPLPRTIRALILHPGQLFREYLQGRRKRYYKPISFFILATVLYIFFRWLTDFDPFLDNEPQPSQQVPGSERFFAAGRYMFQNINNLLFFFVLTLAGFLKLFFYRHYSLAEYIAVSFYLIGFYTLIAIINPVVYKYISHNIQFLATLIMCVYFIHSMISFFQKKPWLVGIKSLVIYFFAFFFYVVLAYLFSYVVIIIKGI